MKYILNNSNYRPDVDGLRAVAVLAVLFFHLNFTSISGGFVGVDIFFVISGYLITNILYNEYQQNKTLDLKNFYYRRLRRLYPALLVTLLFTFIGIVVLMPPPYNVNAIFSNIYAILGLSNFNFWFESGYFENSKYLKPLLHTWSLGVEEQFYLFWPLFLGFIFVRYSFFKLFVILLFILIGTFFTSLILFNDLFLSYFTSDLDFWSYERVNSAAFFMMPFRVFEFAIGAILVFINYKSSKALENILSLLGFGILIYYFTNFSELEKFPYYNALIVTIATALIIKNKNALINTYLLSNKLFVSIGKISYSLYLVHWPLIVFYMISKGKNLDIYDQLLILLFSFLFSILLYFFVEKKFRYIKKTKSERKENKKKYILSIFLIMTLFIILSIIGIKTNSFSGLLNKESEVINNIVNSERTLSKEAIIKIRKLKNETSFSKTEKKKVLLIGDSMANDLNLGFNIALSDKIEIRILNLSHKCQFMQTDRSKLKYYKKKENLVKVCNKRMNDILNSDIVSEADVIIIAHNWYNFIVDSDVTKAINILKTKTNSSIYIIGKRVFLTKGVKETIADLLYKVKEVNTFNEYLFKKYKYSKDVEKRLVNITNKTNTNYISMIDIQCSSKSKKCVALDKDFNLLYRDSLHWTENGSDYFIQEILKKNKKLYNELFNL